MKQRKTQAVNSNNTITDDQLNILCKFYTDEIHYQINHCTISDANEYTQSTIDSYNRAYTNMSKIEYKHNAWREQSIINEAYAIYELIDGDDWTIEHNQYWLEIHVREFMKIDRKPNILVVKQVELYFYISKIKFLFDVKDLVEDLIVNEDCYGDYHEYSQRLWAMLKDKYEHCEWDDQLFDTHEPNIIDTFLYKYLKLGKEVK